MTKTKKLGIAAMLIAICTGVGVASANNGSDGDDAQRTEMKAKWEARKQEMLAKYDTNKDGKLDAAEKQVMRDDMISQRFAKLDVNNDGKLSLDEFKAGMQKRFEHGHGRRGHFGGRRHGGFRHGGGDAE